MTATGYRIKTNKVTTSSPTILMMTRGYKMKAIKVTTLTPTILRIATVCWMRARN
jgi:hypothetical protein